MSSEAFPNQQIEYANQPSLETPLHEFAKIGSVPVFWNDHTSKEDGPKLEIIDDFSIRSGLNSDDRPCILTVDQRQLLTLFMEAEGWPVSVAKAEDHLRKASQALQTEFKPGSAVSGVRSLRGILNSLHSEPILAYAHSQRKGELVSRWMINTHTSIIDRRASSKGPTIVERLDYPAKQRQSLTADLPNDMPIDKRLSIQFLQDLPMHERAAVYTAHCLGRLFTTPMIEAGWRKPQSVLDAFGLASRAQLIKHVQEQIMPKVRYEIEVAARNQNNREVSPDGVAAMLRALAAEDK